MKPFLCVSVCLLLHTSLHTADQPAVNPAALSIDQAARLAWEQSRDVLIAQAQLLGAEAQGRTQTAFLKPQLELSASYIRENEGEATLGQSTLEDIYQSQIALNQFLYGFGKRQAAKNAASYRSLAASAHFKQMRNEASSLARRAYTDIWLSQANVEINSLRVEQRKNEVDDSKALQAAGSISALDLRLAEINYATAVNNLTQAQGELALAILELARLLSIAHENGQAPFSIVGSLDQKSTITPLLARAEQRLLSTSDLAALRAQQDLELSQQQFAESDAYPQIAAFAQYNGIGEEFDDSEYQWQLGVSLTWKIYDGGSRAAHSQVSAAQAQSFEQQFLKLSEAKQQMLQASIINAETLQRNLSQQREIIQLAEKNYSDTRLLYKSGGTTITRLGDSSLALEEARFSLARYNYQLHNLAITVQQLIEEEPPKQVQAAQAVSNETPAESISTSPPESAKDSND